MPPAETQQVVLLDHALQYAGRGWRVFPVHTTVGGACSCGRECGKDAGKHPRIKAWQKHATTDAGQITKWWTRWPQSNIGIATGGGIVVTDLDGPAEVETFRRAVAEPHGGLPPTLVAQTARGFHIYLAGDWHTTRKVPDRHGLLVRGTGGFVVAPPSFHASGIRYSWAKDLPVAEMPQWFSDWLQSSEHTGLTAGGGFPNLGPAPAYISSKTKVNQQDITRRAKSALGVSQTVAELQRIQSALGSIPASCARDPWLHVGFALHSLHWERPDGTDAGFDLWNDWSATCPDKYSLFDVETRWRSFGKEGREGIGLGSLFHIAENHGWTGNLPRRAPDEDEKKPPANGQGHTNNADITSATGGHDTLLGSMSPHSTAHVNGHTLQLPDALSTPSEESPLIMLNQKYACIGDLGGKCLVLGWVPSKVDPLNEVPSFQTFKSFAERFGNQYITVRVQKKDGYEEEKKQLGPWWLKWAKRRTFDGIDLDPAGGQTINGNVLNLWRGFAVQPAAGSWELMKRHIAEVLADGDPAAIEYIVKWSAWAVQNPGERAEAALVFRGGKGSGKGTFAHALRRLFGAHGLHISNPKHLVGAFNAHLRNCLLLYADEAFWAGDKQGESTLKALITESTLTIEQKGVDAVQWHNRIHLIMTANADWVVPASHDERRYAVFNVSEKFMEDSKYFDSLHQEIDNGGLSAMLHDLQNVDLKGWHPRRILKTRALTEQKIQSMNPLQEWWESLLQAGSIPAAPKEHPDTAYAQYLMNHAREFAPKLRDMTPTRLGRFLSDHGCTKLHKASGNAWRFPELENARISWARHYSGWTWEQSGGEWAPKT